MYRTPPFPVSTGQRGRQTADPTAPGSTCLENGQNKNQGSTSARQYSPGHTVTRRLGAATTELTENTPLFWCTMPLHKRPWTSQPQRLEVKPQANQYLVGKANMRQILRLARSILQVPGSTRILQSRACTGQVSMARRRSCLRRVCSSQEGLRCIRIRQRCCSRPRC